MKKEITALLSSLRADTRIHFYDEIRTKQAIVLRMLHALGWDTFNVEEVFPDYPVGGEKIDYSLRYDNENLIFIMVRRPGEELSKYAHLLLELSRKATAHIGLLTDGIEWQFYLPLRLDGHECKFHTLDIQHQNQSELVKKFIAFLAKEHVRKGKSEEDGEKVFKSRKKKSLIKDALTKAWNDNINGTDTSILEILAQRAEKISGYPPEPEIVQWFLKSALKKGGIKVKAASIKEPEKVKAVAEPKKRGRTKASAKPKAETKEKTPGRPGRKKKSTTLKRDNFIGKKPKAFTFLGRRMKARKWKEILTNVCNILANTSGDSFVSVLDLTGRKRRYFSRDLKDLKEPRQVQGTDIFVETNFNAQNLIMITYKVLKSFGYSESDISFETK